MRAAPTRPIVVAACALAAAAAMAGTAAATGSHPADLAIAKASDRDVYAPGDTIRYTVTVTNAGDSHVARARIAVSDPALPGLAPAGAGADWLGPGESMVLRGQRVATVADCGALDNTATVALYSGREAVPDADASNDSATRTVQVAGPACGPPAGLLPARATPAPAPSGLKEAMPQAQAPACPAPRLSARIAGPSEVRGGEAALFTLGVRNAAGPPARRARLTLRLPRGFALAGPVEAATVAGGAMTWRIGTLPPRAGRTLAVRLRADRGAAGRRAVAASVSAACGRAAATALVRVAQGRQAQVAPPVTG